MDPKKLLAFGVFIFFLLAAGPVMALQITPDFELGSTMFIDPSVESSTAVNVNLYNNESYPVELRIFSTGITATGSFLRLMGGDVMGTFSFDPGETQSVSAFSFFDEKLDFTSASYVAAEIGDIMNVMTMSFIGVLDDVFTSWSITAESFERDYLFSVEVGTPPITAAPVPEPATILLLGGGLIGLFFYRKKSIRA